MWRTTNGPKYDYGKVAGMRLFTAVEPPPEAVAQLSSTVHTGRELFPELRWTSPEDWHLTLVFLGEVLDELVPDLAEGLGRAVSGHHPLSLEVDGWGTFPEHSRRSSVLWAGFAGDTEPLTDLADDLREAARGVGLHVTDMPYVPHLTVARSRPARDLRRTLHELSAPQGPAWRVGEVHLVESVPGRSPRYRTARTWPLPWKTHTDRTSERSTS